MAENLSNLLFEYVQSNTFIPEHDDDTNVARDGFEVLHDFFLFYRRRKNKDRVSRAHPNIHKSIQVFQTQETSSFVKYKHALEASGYTPFEKLVQHAIDLACFKHEAEGDEQ
ncbi:unnamed protein product [Brachionus calyciflorus]|uniref:Uncharacterized protein n=1 Tax=Brachionus calyciflorus TaxID=104777 RepID=A0A814K5N9_9BILA|nr:unnamed protein product [Brachionus calyciflorus]